MLIDDVQITVAAGDGGDGAVAFQKNVMSLGPTGTTGGNGGNVYAKGVADIGALRRFRFTKNIKAQHGQAGRGQFRDGADGKDAIFEVPVGTVIHNLETKTTIEITKINEQVLIVSGGRGGKGNFHFRSSRNTSPTQFQPGKPGEHAKLRLELKLIADVGLVGLPNAGKSSLINALTRAKSRVAAYPFTTLEPSLGAYYGLIIADIPGLIEGASTGKGLGTKFLRHIERTETLLHLVSCESDNVVRDVRVIREELAKHNPALAKKSVTLLLTKTDLADEATVKKQLTALTALAEEMHATAIIPISVEKPDTLEPLHELLRKLIVDKTTKTS